MNRRSDSTRVSRMDLSTEKGVTAGLLSGGIPGLYMTFGPGSGKTPGLDARAAAALDRFRSRRLEGGARVPPRTGRLAGPPPPIRPAECRFETGGRHRC